MATLTLDGVEIDGLWITTRENSKPTAVKSGTLKIESSECFIWRLGQLVAIGSEGKVLNSAGHLVGTIDPPGERKKYKVPSHVDQLAVGIWEPYPDAFRHSVNQFGHAVPVYFFTQMEIDVELGVWRNIIKHVDKFCTDKFERMAQIVGHFTAPAVTYSRDIVLEGSHVEQGDDFSCPASSPFTTKVGDCEDFAILAYCMFNNLKFKHSDLVPQTDGYVAALVDCIIQDAEHGYVTKGLHMCCMLIPVQLFDHWLEGDEVKDERAGNPILLLESTERSLSSLRPCEALKSFYMDRVDTAKYSAMYDRLSLLYPVEQYRREKFYVRFYSIYTNHGPCRHYMPSIKDKIGMSLEDLLSDQRFAIELHPRFEEEDVDAADEYLKTCLPPNLTITANPQPDCKASGFPVYFPTERIASAIHTTWDDVEITAVEKLQVSPCFDAMYVAYLKNKQK